MPVLLTVDVGWPWWVITAIAFGVVVVSVAAAAGSRNVAVRAVGGLLAVQGAVIAVLAPFVMSDVNPSSAMAAGGSAMTSHSSSVSIHVIEHAAPAHMKMVGSVQLFANPIFDSHDAKQVGRDQGFCVHIALAKGFECVWTTILPGGDITSEGPEPDSGNLLPFAITGGTGRYKNARGWLTEKVHNKAATEFDEFFHVVS